MATAKHLVAGIREVLVKLAAVLGALPEWVAPAIHSAMTGVAAEAGIGFGKLGQPVRVAVTGGTVSPPIDVTLELLGRDRTLRRLQSAIDAIPSA